MIGPDEGLRNFVDDVASLPGKSVNLDNAKALVAAVNLERDNAEAICPLAEIFIQTGRADEAAEILARIPESPETRRLAALARIGADGGGDIDAALAGLLPQVKLDEAARQKFVDLLEVLGAADPRTADWRRRLSAALF